jgi:hypothetical protein
VSDTPPHIRFREARERLGLSPDEVAVRSGIPTANVWDIEMCEGDLERCYSPTQIRNFCRVLIIQPSDLFGDKVIDAPVSAGELGRRVREECCLRGVTLEQFEDIVGWRLSACIEPPEKLLDDLTVDGLQWLCRELRIDWRRAL